MKKYVVTDPCYILSDEAWDECCKLLGNGTEKDFEAFNTAIAGELTKLSGETAYVEDTGYGDWSNEIYGSNIINRTFAADAGMVCVCLLTPEIEKKLNIQEHDHCVAVFQTEELISVKFDTDDSNWTVVNIKIKEGCIWSKEPYDEYEEDEDEDQEDEEW